jgi:putative ABC transport system permease protein
MVVVVLGLFGGLYPAWRASRLKPIEALRYEGGTSGSHIRRLPVGGMAVQGLWQRSTRTFLTLFVIGITVGAIMSLDGVMASFKSTFSDMMTGADAQVVLWQDDVADTTMSALDERIGEKLNAMPEIEAANGMIFTGIMLPETNNFFMLEGYDPNGFAIRRFNVIDGKPLSGNRQMILGQMMANTMKKKVGDSIEIGGSRFRVVGIYESSAGWEELGGVMSLRDAQAFTGRPRKVSMYAVRLRDPNQARSMADRLNKLYPDLQAGLSGEFVEQLPDMQNSDAMMNAISVLAVLVGGLGVLNTMLMSVLERTREIGVLRAMGWRRRAILGLVIREALILGVAGGLVGIGVAFFLSYWMFYLPGMEGMLQTSWTLEIFARAISAALLLGLLGGLYPAYRATRLPPIEALRYE